MSIVRSIRRPWGLWIFAIVVLSLFAAPPAGADDPLPWEIWTDLGELARLGYDHQVVMRSSRCPDGCAYDRHADGDSRFVRTEGDEGVIFETTGAGAITRIWMTQGEGGVSQPLDENIRIRLTLDGAATPVVDLPLPDFFGSQPPFTPPLAVDRTQSSGGNISYVPIPFVDGCRLSLVGAENERIWFQVSGHRLASADGVTSFTGGEDLSAWRALLASPGSDPWVDGASHPSISGMVTLDPGEVEVVAELAGPDSLTGLLIDTPRDRWGEIVLVLEFDSQAPTEMALDDFFAIGRAAADATRSLMIGANAGDELFCYYPMPFFRSARVALRLPEGASLPVFLDFTVRRRDRVPAADSGIFGAQLRVIENSAAGADSPIAVLEGPGRWVGLFLEAGSIATQSQAFLEGDERVHADGSRHPAFYGTGVEDFFGGGFYYRVDGPVSTPFRRALHGMTYDLIDATGRAMGMYRLMLADAPVFSSELVVGLEGGPVNQTPVRFRAVAYAYLRESPPMRRRDLLDVGDPSSRNAHSYGVIGEQSCSALYAFFEDEPPTSLGSTLCSRSTGVASFVLRGAQRGQRLVLRRRFDVGEGDQRSNVSVGGLPGPSLAFEDANPHRRWRERETLLGEWDRPNGEVSLAVSVPSGGPRFSESLWELWAGYPPGRCDLVIDGWCDAADLSEHVRVIDGGGEVDELVIAVGAIFG